MSRAVRLTSDWGSCRRPSCTPSRRAATPRRSARSSAGLPARYDSRLTTLIESTADGSRAQPGVGRGRADRLDHQVDRRRACRVVRPVHVLADADDDRAAGVDGHGRARYEKDRPRRFIDKGKRARHLEVLRRCPASPSVPITPVSSSRPTSSPLLAGQGHEITDVGTDSTASVDYPPFCAAVGRAVRDGDADLGIVVGGSGQGEQLAANKVRGVRAALCNELYTARLARAHNDANVLAIGAPRRRRRARRGDRRTVPGHPLRGRPARAAGRPDHGTRSRVLTPGLTRPWRPRGVTGAGRRIGGRAGNR